MKSAKTRRFPFLTYYCSKFKLRHSNITQMIDYAEWNSGQINHLFTIFCDDGRIGVHDLICGRGLGRHGG